MYDKSQLMRGTLEGAILKILSKEENYGYEIMVHLQKYGFEELKEGTIYPLLIRLEKKGMIQGEFKPSPLGPDRKYYTISEEGEEYLKEFELCWKMVEESMNRILEGDD
nr:PadR family transcriptional regulator [uncultured Sellimonas sp.]